MYCILYTFQKDIFYTISFIPAKIKLLREHVSKREKSMCLKYVSNQKFEWSSLRNKPYLYPKIKVILRKFSLFTLSTAGYELTIRSTRLIFSKFRSL